VENKDTEINLLITRPLSSSVEHVPGFTESKCARCGQAVSISPSGVKIVKLKELQVVCFMCLTEDEIDKLRFHRLTPDQQREARQVGGIIPDSSDSAKLQLRTLRAIHG
jgi:hypothetical protein